ncbi:MAG: hypothetical protein IT267_06860 [Saprospiraceae bacterium]|nr:hypothetical protein [Saprospiraceae bacterium]
MFLHRHKWISEIIWWNTSLLICGLMLYPIYYYQIDFPFYYNNILFILGFFIFLRWVLLWHLTPYARWQWLKLIIILSMFPVLFLLSYEFSDFKNYIDEVGLQELVTHLKSSEQDAMTKYIRTEFIFFSICCIINGFLVPFKLIWNIWKQHNLGSV